jgi:hypothetical protein
MANSSFVLKTLPQVEQINLEVLYGGDGGVRGSGGGIGGGAVTLLFDGSSGFLGYG